MKGLFNKVLVALTITTLVAGSANGMDYVTGFFSKAKEVAGNAYAGCTKENISKAYAACTKENFVASAVAAKDAVVALPTTYKVAGAAVAVAGVAYLAKNQIAKFVNKFYPTLNNNNKQGGYSAVAFYNEFQGGLVQNNMGLAASFRSKGASFLTATELDRLTNIYSEKGSEEFAAELKKALKLS